MKANLGWRSRGAALLTSGTVALMVAGGGLLVPAAAHAAPGASFVANVATAQDGVTPTALVPTVSSASAAGLVVNVELSGISSQTGAYVSLIEAGTSGQLTSDNMGIAFQWVNAFTDGAATTTLDAAAEGLDRTKSYEVISWRGHTLPSDATIFNVAPLTVSTAQWDTVFGANELPTPTVTVVTDVSNLDSEVETTVTVEGSGFLPKAPETSGTRPPLAGKFTGTYIAFGSYLEDWKYSAGAPAGARKNLDTKWAVLAEDLPAISSMPGAISMQADGTFSTTLKVKKDDAQALADGTYGIVTYPGGGAKYAPFETFTPVTFKAPAAAPTLTAKVTKATTAGLEVKADLKNIVSTTGAYAALIEAGTSGELSRDNMGIGADWIVPGSFTAEGAAAVTLKAPAGKLDRSKSYEVVSWRGHSLPSAETIFNVVPLKVTAAQWDAVFEKPAVKIPFTDVKKGDKFFKEISWMFTEGVSTGTKQPDNSVKYEPKASVTREAMAAFLFRQYAPKDFKVTGDVEFTDVKKSDKFFKQIAWMAQAGISTGTKQADGSVKFEPKNEISREAMAAFLYRVDTNKKPKAPAASPFADVKKGDKFYDQIVWMYQANISTGNANGTKRPNYLPKSDVTREAMAAFLYRAAPAK